MLNSLIARCIAIKTGDKDFALFYLHGDPGEPYWRADIGNISWHAALGEIDGDYRGEGATPEQAVSDLIDSIHSGRIL